MQLFDIALIKLTALIYLVYEGLNLILVAEELTGGCFVFGLLCFKLLLFFKAFLLCFVNLSLRFAQLVLGLFELFNLFVKAVDNPLFVLINSYTTGLQPQVIKNILLLNAKNKNAECEAYEVGLPTDEGIILPCGASGLLTF